MPPKKIVKPTRRELPADKQKKAEDLATNTGLAIKGTRQVERPSKETVIVENLATYYLPDDTTITVDLDHPNAEKIVEKAKGRVLQDIEAGKRPPKKK